MRILHCDTDDLDNPLRGGAPVRTYQINSRLAERHDVEVLTATYERSQDTRLRGKVRYATRGFGIRGFGLSHHLTYLAALGPSLKQRPHDLVVEEFMPPCGFCLLPLWTPKPVVSIVQWFFFDEWQARYKLPFERMMRTIPRRLRYRHFIVQSRRMADYFRELIPQASISVVPCGIDASALCEQTEPGSYALYLGRLARHQKGLDLLLEAWRSLTQAGIRIPLRIVGSGPDQRWIEDEIAAAGMESFVSMPGRMEGPAKLECLKACRFLVMPSREETFGLSALEAMAVSRPVVAFDIDHLNELVRPDWGVLVPPGDLAGFAQAAAVLWRAPSRCVDLGVRAHAAATAYTWDRLAVRQESIYLNIARDRSPS
jgi:glycosyltransferase involved in cell wall biosynthesis